MLLLYQAIAFLTFTAFTMYPMNILAEMYGGAQVVSTIYTVCVLLGIVVQLILVRFVGKIKSIKSMGVIFGVISLVMALCLMIIPPSQPLLWQICFGLESLFVTLYALFSLGILVGQWFPRRKGTVMGVATIAFPISSALVSVFAASVFGSGIPNVFGAFLPFFAVCLIGLLIGVIFIKDYPEQCGAYRDNDKNFDLDAAKRVMEQEIINKKTSVWTIQNTLKNRDFWFITIPIGFLLFCTTGLMSQTMSIVIPYGNRLDFIGGFSGIMLVICAFAGVGSWLFGMLDTKFGTKKAILAAVMFMIIGGLLGLFSNIGCLLISLFCLGIYMGASSNFTVSAAAQYWRREDFPNVFASLNPTANIIQSLGPMSIAILIGSQGFTSASLVVAIGGIVSLVLILMFKSKHVKEVDDAYRVAAGKEIDDELESRK